MKTRGASLRAEGKNSLPGAKDKSARGYKLRVFVAALLPAEVKDKVLEFCSELKGGLEGVKWEGADKLHITLKFIGNVDTDEAEGIKRKVEKITSGFGPFKLSFLSFRAFPNFKNPRVLVLTLKCEDDILSMKERIDSDLFDSGYDREDRKFTPHITLARVKRGFKTENRQVAVQEYGFIIDEIAVVKSELSPGGSKYTNIGVYKLT